VRFASLGSGSRGNGTLIEADGTCVLVDCGFSVRETERRLLRLGTTPEALTAILVTHEHGDHLRGVAALSRKYRLPVWMTAGTHAACAGDPPPRVELFHSHEAFPLDGLEVRPFPVPHDAREPCQFIFGDGARTVGLLTDTGRPTPHIISMLTGCDALLLECNHDPDLLAASRYPPSVRRRVAGPFGHLSNRQSADLLAELCHGSLQHVAALHLSEENNTPALARAGLARVLGCAEEEVAVADQRAGLGWREVG